MLEPRFDFLQLINNINVEAATSCHFAQDLEKCLSVLIAYTNLVWKTKVGKKER